VTASSRRIIEPGEEESEFWFGLNMIEGILQSFEFVGAVFEEKDK
jgi:hypothetical protein